MKHSDLKPGDMAKFYSYEEENMIFEVRCRSERFIILTTTKRDIAGILYYMIIDLAYKIRGPDNVIFSSSYTTDEDCRERLAELESGEIEVSHRPSRCSALLTNDILISNQPKEPS